MAGDGATTEPPVAQRSSNDDDAATAAPPFVLGDEDEGKGGLLASEALRRLGGVDDLVTAFDLRWLRAALAGVGHGCGFGRGRVFGCWWRLGHDNDVDTNNCTYAPHFEPKTKPIGRRDPHAAGSGARAGGGHGRGGAPDGGAGAGAICVLCLLCVYVYVSIHISRKPPTQTPNDNTNHDDKQGWYDAWCDWLLHAVYGPLLVSSLPPRDPKLLAAAVQCLATEGLCGDPRAQEVGGFVDGDGWMHRNRGS